MNFLKQKWWYRFLQVFWGLSLLFVLLVMSYLVYDENKATTIFDKENASITCAWGPRSGQVYKLEENGILIGYDDKYIYSYTYPEANNLCTPARASLKSGEEYSQEEYLILFNEALDKKPTAHFTYHATTKTIGGYPSMAWDWIKYGAGIIFIFLVIRSLFLYIAVGSSKT